MLPKDESQHHAELRQAFLKHLPRRAEAIRKRGLRICKGDWDVNTVTLLYQDVQGLAGAAGRYGLVDGSEKLFQIERALEPLIKQLRLPESADKQQIALLLDGLIEVANPPAPQIRNPRDFVVAPPDKLAGSNVPLFLRPPEDCWRRFSQSDISLITSETHGTAPARLTIAPPKEWVLGDPEPPGLRLDAPAQIVNATSVFGLDANVAPAAANAAPHPISEKPERQTVAGRIFYLSDVAPFARELSHHLLELNFQVERLSSSEELKEALGSLTAEAVVIDASFFEQLEHLGEFIKRVRASTQLKIPLLTFSVENDLAARLKAMRAGADLFIPLPISAKDATKRARELLELTTSDPFKVMIVEDDRSQAIFAESVLRKAGFETLAITDPLETLDRLERFKPDLILMDLYMPNISGMELTSIIREREQFINTPIVFLSGEQDSEKHFEALSAGGDDFLAKPIRPKHLISAVNNRARRARQMARRKTVDPRDSTTGLYYRTYLIDRLNELLNVDDRSQQHGGILFIDIEGMQKLREQRGLAVYEPVLRQLGATIASFTQENELATRYGDSSFVLLSSARALPALQSLAASIVAKLAQDMVEVDQHSVRVAARIGVAPFSTHLADAADMLNAAERASVRARQLPTGVAVHVHEASEGSTLADAVRAALDGDQLQLLFQPIVSLHSTGEEQYEVLLRMRSEGGDMIGAAQVLDAARSAGLVVAIDRWCLAQCLRIIEDRKRQGRPVRLFINQCVESTMDAERIPWLRQQLETRRIAPDAVVLEVKLSDVLSSMREALAFFESVRKLGVRVVVDEFDGSLTALQLLSVLSADFLKLADKYTTGNGNYASDELRTLIRAAHDGGKYVIAAKVENAQSAATLWTLGVDLIQGNFVQQPGTDLGFDFSASAL